MTAYKTYKFADGRQLEIIHDDDPQSPRDWDNLGTMACWARNHHLGDEQIKEGDFPSKQAVKEHIQEENPDCIILPLYLYDHGGITMNTTGFDCQWDSGQVGFIYISREKIAEEFGNSRTDKEIEQYLRNEVSTYDQYLTGDIYGFVMREPPCDKCSGEGEIGDSCWGFYGEDPIENGIVDHIEDKYREMIVAGDCEEVC